MIALSLDLNPRVATCFQKKGGGGTPLSAADAKRYAPPIFNVTSLILRPRERLDTPRAVNRVLTRILRLLAEGRISSRDASALGYIGQLISGTLPYLERAAARKEAAQAHSDNGSAINPEALNAFQAVLQSLQEPAPASPAPPAVNGSDRGEKS